MKIATTTLGKLKTVFSDIKKLLNMEKNYISPKLFVPIRNLFRSDFSQFGEVIKYMVSKMFQL